jgi:hypothetical protein
VPVSLFMLQGKHTHLPLRATTRNFVPLATTRMTFADGDGACRRLTNTEGLTSFVPTLATVRLAGARRCDCTIRRRAWTGSSSRSVTAADGFASRGPGSGCPLGDSCARFACVVSGLAPETAIPSRAGSWFAGADGASLVSSEFRGKDCEAVATWRTVSASATRVASGATSWIESLA